MKSLSPAKLLKNINSRYSTGFLTQLISMPEVRVFVFGGLVRDILLGKKWKDLDIRIIINKAWSLREKTIESVLKKYGGIKEKIRFKEFSFTVYRFMPNKSRSRQDIDVTVAPTMQQAKSDFTINDMFVDMRTGKLIDRHGGIRDLRKRMIRTVSKPEHQFEEEPWMIARIIKASCQFNFSIDPVSRKAMRRNAWRIKSVFEYIGKNRKDVWSEVLLSNLFRGMAYDPVKFFKLFEESGLLKYLILYFNGGNSYKKPSIINNKLSRSASFEQNLSFLLSSVAQSVDARNSEIIFKKIRHQLILDEPKTHGEFPVKHKLITYIPR